MSVKLTSSCQSSVKVSDLRPSSLVTCTNLCQVITTANPTCRKWYISNLITCWYWLALIDTSTVTVPYLRSILCPQFSLWYPVIAPPRLRVEITNDSKSFSGQSRIITSHC